jgi:hypothetical protein
MPGFGSVFEGWSGFTTFIEVVVFLILVGIVWRARRNAYAPGTTIVIKKFHLDEDPTAKVSVDITGRAAGIIAWALNLLRLETDFQLTVSDSEFTVREASLTGTQFTYVPLGQITAAVCGYQRSIWAFAFAVYFAFVFVLNLLGGIFAGSNGNETAAHLAAAFGALIFAGIAGLLYFLSKRIVISAETIHRHGICFKRSVIENVSVDLPQALRAIAVINAKILAAQVGYSQGNGGGLSTSPEIRPKSPIGSELGRCPKCSALNAMDMQFCENCGAAVSA